MNEKEYFDFSENKYIKIYERRTIINRIKQADNRYKNIGDIASGSFGIVYKCTNVNKNKPIAIKIMLKDRITNATEIEFYKTLLKNKQAKKNVAKIYGIYSDTDKYYLVMGYYKYELNRRLIEKGVIPENRIINIMYQILSFINIIHNERIILNDIKSENILIDIRNDFKPIIIDFGLISHYDEKSNLKGTAYFIPPETIIDSDLITNDKKDMWAFGLTMYEFLINNFNFNFIINQADNGVISIDTEKISNELTRMKVKLGTIDNIFTIAKTIEIRKCIFDCLNLDYNKRPSAKDLLEYPLFKNM